MFIPDYDLYAVLGVPMNADKATIRQAYSRLIRQLHPDLHPEHERAGLHNQTAKVTTAWEYLADPSKRRAYDASRPAPSSPPPPPRSKPQPPSPPPRPTPKPRPPRIAIRVPEAVGFGVVRVGDQPEQQMVWLGFRGGSRIRTVRLGQEAGRFWRATIVRGDDGRSVRIYFDGLTIPRTTLSGLLVDHLHVQLDEVAVDIALSAMVEVPPPPPAPGTPPWRPTSAPSPPRRPTSPPASASAPSPQPRSTTTPRSLRRRGGKGKRVVAGMALTLAALTFGPKVLHHFGTHEPLESSPKASGEFCSISSSHGQMLSFYPVKPGTTQRANLDPTWVIMVPHRGDPYLAWWTPQFPYWERGNTSDGPTNPAFQYFEVSAVWADGWTPLANVFADYPNLVGGPAAEAAGRQSFITKWHAQQGSPRCS